MKISQDKEFILSNSGEVRGRKNLVKEIANSSFSDRILIPIFSKDKSNFLAKQKEIKPILEIQQLNSKTNEDKIKNKKCFEFFQNNQINPKFGLISNCRLHQTKPDTEKFVGYNEPKNFSFTSIISAKEQYEISKENSKYFPRPNLETSSNRDSVDSTSVIKRDAPEQVATDFGYLDYITQIQKLNEDNWKSLELPDLYSYEYENSKSNKKSFKGSNQKNEQKSKYGEKENFVNYTDHSETINKSSNDCFETGNNRLSRNSSIRSYNKMLPVGKFAKQKFRVIQEEEELIECPIIYDINGLPIPNLEITNEFDCVSESVLINISKLTNVEVVVNILVNKFIKKKQLGKPWIKKIIEITRTISINVEASGEKEKVEKLINDVQKNKNEKYSIKASIYRLRGKNVQLSGYSAFKIFKILMKIAENCKNDNYSNFDNKHKFTPQYLLAVLEDPNCSFFPCY